MLSNALLHLYEQRATERDGRGRSVGPGPATVLGDEHYGPPAEEGHVRGQAADGGGTGDVCVRDCHPVIVDHQPQIRLQASSGRLSGEEELVDSFDRRSERAGSSVEGSAHVHQNLAVLDSVHFPSELARKRSKEVDLFGRL